MSCEGMYVYQKDLLLFYYCNAWHYAINETQELETWQIVLTSRDPLALY